jgi:hypothetical protein
MVKFAENSTGSQCRNLMPHGFFLSLYVHILPPFAPAALTYVQNKRLEDNEMADEWSNKTPTILKERASTS